MTVDMFYRHGSSLDMPKRPAWHRDMSKVDVQTKVTLGKKLKCKFRVVNKFPTFIYMLLYFGLKSIPFSGKL